MFDSNPAATVAAKKKKPLTKRERAKRDKEHARLAYEDSLAKALRDDISADRFDCVIDAVTGIWKIRGEKFDKDELKHLDALLEANPKIIEELVSKYKVEWWNTRSLMVYMDGYHGPRPKGGMALPAAGYLWRACVAFQGGDTSEILDDGGPTGLGGMRRATCLNREQKVAARCPPCRNGAARLVRDTQRKSMVSETTARRETERGASGTGG